MKVSAQQLSSTGLIDECSRRLKDKRLVTVFGFIFVFFLLRNGMRGKNRWGWTDIDHALFSNLYSRVGLNRIRFITSELG